MKSVRLLPLLAALCILLAGCQKAEEISVPKPQARTTTVSATKTAAATAKTTAVTTEKTTEAAGATTAAATTKAAETEKTTEKATTQAATKKAATKAAEADSTSLSSKGYEIKRVDGITYVDGVMVVNKSYSLPASYSVGDLTAECDSAYMEMKAAAKKAGHSLYISSGFRDYETQEIIYNRYVANDGKANADRYSARPGHSEHQTGLAIDLNGVSDSFGDTAAGKWVAAHCHEYGFILRYPKGKEAQTGYMYEPWHIRYVGKEAAADIAASGLCLEEYYGITSEYQS